LGIFSIARVYQQCFTNDHAAGSWLRRFHDIIGVTFRGLLGHLSQRGSSQAARQTIEFLIEHPAISSIVAGRGLYGNTASGCRSETPTADLCPRMHSILPADILMPSWRWQDNTVQRATHVWFFETSHGEFCRTVCASNTVGF